MKMTVWSVCGLIFLESFQPAAGRSLLLLSIFRFVCLRRDEPLSFYFFLSLIFSAWFPPFQPPHPPRREEEEEEQLTEAENNSMKTKVQIFSLSNRNETAESVPPTGCTQPPELSVVWSSSAVWAKHVLHRDCSLRWEHWAGEWTYGGFWLVTDTWSISCNWTEPLNRCYRS